MSRLLLYLLGFVGEVFMLTSIYLVMPVGRLSLGHALFGAVVAAGADNLQDPFNPLGRGCPFETAALMVLAAHLSPAEAWASVTGPRGIAVGQPADLIAVRASSLREAIAMGAPDRQVWRAPAASAGARSPRP